MGLLSCEGAIGMTLRVGAAVSSKSSVSRQGGFLLGYCLAIAWLLLGYCLSLALLFDKPQT